MNRLSNFVFTGTFLWLLGGCVIQTDPSEKNAFEGVYKVTSHTRNEMDCTSPGTAVADGDAFFKLGEETLFGTKILAYRSCTDATTCATDLSLFESFIDEGNGWVRQVKTTSGTTTCALGLVEGPLVETETGLTLDTKTFRGEVMLGASEKCDIDLVDAHRSDLACAGLESLVAEKQ